MGTAVLSEIGTLHLEFVYLSNITGNPKYSELVTRLRNTLVKARVKGLYSNVINIGTGKFSEGASKYFTHPSILDGVRTDSVLI